MLVGFAAETHDVIEHARGKLTRKAVDLIVANDVSRVDAGFEVDTNAVTLVTSDATEPLPLATKDAVAASILDRAERLIERTSSPSPTR